jgi:hypothetical protein
MVHLLGERSWRGIRVKSETRGGGVGFADGGGGDFGRAEEQ